MCLATVYKESDDSVIFKNVSRIDVDGDKVILRDIMGDERVVEGRILMVGSDSLYTCGGNRSVL